MEQQPQHQIIVMGETSLHTLAVITPAHDTHFGMSVGDVINFVAGRNGFVNLNQLALKTPAGIELKRGTFLKFKLSPIVHLFTLKGRPEQDIQEQKIRVFRYRDGGPCIKFDLQSDQIDMTEVLIYACIHFDLEIEQYELVAIEHQGPFDFYLQFKEQKVKSMLEEGPTYQFDRLKMNK